ncbi:hypothetical protein, partial [Microcystis sp.]|uniref:hypothetical protein n=1 Tax=Microcystis sp. TaxID=1127 RepID=UPI003919DE70
VISYQLSVISYQLSVISYQLSVISYQLSVISYQLSVISYQGYQEKKVFDKSSRRSLAERPKSHAEVWRLTAKKSPSSI